MVNSREIWEDVVAGLAKLGLTVALVVLGAFFMVGAAHGDDAHRFFLLDPPRADVGATTVASQSGYGAPHALGSVLALGVLGIGVLVLLLGAIRSEQPDAAASVQV